MLHKMSAAVTPAINAAATVISAINTSATVTSAINTAATVTPAINTATTVTPAINTATTNTATDTVVKKKCCYNTARSNGVEMQQNHSAEKSSLLKTYP